jgi:hypothetical protein
MSCLVEISTYAERALIPIENIVPQLQQKDMSQQSSKINTNIPEWQREPIHIQSVRCLLVEVTFLQV